MQKKVVILTSGHYSLDERIFYKFGRSLIKNNYAVSIISSLEELKLTKFNININSFNSENLSKRQKISKFLELIINEAPDIIICCEPITIIAANRYKKRVLKSVTIFSDITEWYPENIVSKKTGFKKIISYCILFLFNIYSINLANKIIIGEIYKKKRYDFIAPFKEKKIIGYYPSLDMFQYSSPKLNNKKLTICFAGIISKERGINNVINAITSIAERNLESNFVLKIIGKFNSKDDKIKLLEKFKCTKNVQLLIFDWIDYTEFSSILSDVDVCIDLREKNFIYDNSLPIKIFDYLAVGKPFIYSDIKTLRKESFVKECGFLVKSNDINEVVKKLELYLNDKNLLLKHSQNARRLFENEFNWEQIENKLIKFLEE